MRIIPVLDLLGGQVVRGVAGRRREYRPIVSCLTASARPLDVARAFRDHFGLHDLYLADLDAIAGEAPALDVYDRLRCKGFSLSVDAGIRQAADGPPLLAAGVEAVVAGLETLTGRAALADLCRSIEPGRVIFSLDMKAGRPLATSSAWKARDAAGIAGEAIASGVTRLLLLDLARVGTYTGAGTEDLCRTLAIEHPGVELLAGGGVRDGTDLLRLQQCGVAGVLVASALHDGVLRRADLVACR
jgi:phosphoribosylformimino-5-aminoimidazole carboxamide ribotide isomerase